MTQRQTILSNLASLETAARDLTHYRPRQWADIVMCRDFALWLVRRAVEKATKLNNS